MGSEYSVCANFENIYTGITYIGVVQIPGKNMAFNLTLIPEESQESTYSSPHRYASNSKVGCAIEFLSGN